MAYQIVVGTEQSCPGSSSQWVQWSYSVGSSTILSVGFQNSGLATDFYISQMFPQSATVAYLQVVNTSLTSTNWWPIIVVDTGGDAASTEKGTIKVVESKPLTQKK